MGWCHEFGLHINTRCDHPMVAGKASCTCEICGTECPGKFDKECVEVWDRSQRRVDFLMAKPPGGEGRALFGDPELPRIPSPLSDDLAWSPAEDVEPEGGTQPATVTSINRGPEQSVHPPVYPPAPKLEPAAVPASVARPGAAGPADLTAPMLAPTSPPVSSVPLATEVTVNALGEALGEQIQALTKAVSASAPATSPTVPLATELSVNALGEQIRKLSQVVSTPPPETGPTVPLATELSVNALGEQIRMLAEVVSSPPPEPAPPLAREVSVAAIGEQVEALASAVAQLASTAQDQRGGLEVLRAALTALTATAQDQRDGIEALRKDLADLASRPDPPPPPESLSIDDIEQTMREAMGATVAENRKVSQQIDVAQRQVAELAETLPDRTGTAVAELVTALAQRVESAAGGVEAIGRMRHLLAELSARMGQIQGEVTRLAMAQEAIASSVETVRDRR